MVAKTERTTITLPIGMSEDAQKYGINISYEATQAVSKAIALKGKCPLDITLPDGCPATDCKCTYDEWLTCPQNPIRNVKGV